MENVEFEKVSIEIARIHVTLTGSSGIEMIKIFWTVQFTVQVLF